MSAEFDVESYLSEGFEAELAADLRWERGLAVKCVAAILLVVLMVVLRQLYFA